MEKDELVKMLAGSLKVETENWLNMVGQLGNQCAWTDRQLETVLSLAAKLRSEYKKDELRGKINDAVETAKEAGEKAGAKVFVSSEALIDDEHLNTLWYEHDTCLMTLYYKNFRVTLVVTGDITFEFKGKVYYYSLDDTDITSDLELEEALLSGSLSFDSIGSHNNWLEHRVYEITSDSSMPEFIDSFPLDSDDILEEITDIDGIVEWLEDEFIKAA